MTEKRLALAAAGILLGLAQLQGCSGGSSGDGAAGRGTGRSLVGARDVMFLANAEDGTVMAIDAQSFGVLHTFDVIPDGPGAAFEDDPGQALIGQRIVEFAGGLNYAQDLDLSPDGRRIYVSRGHKGDVAAFDLASSAMLWNTPIEGLRADHMTISPDGRRLYVSALTDDHVYVLDTIDGAVVDDASTGQWPHDNHLADGGRVLYNASIGNVVVEPAVRGLLARNAATSPYKITKIDTATMAPLAEFAFDRGVRPFELSRDEARIFAQLSEFNGVIEFDLITGTITRELSLPVKEGTSEDDYDFEAPHHGLALSRDESTLCLAGRVSDYVALVDVASFTATAIIPVGDAPSWSATSPDGRHCFVANNRDDSVSVISYARRREIARIPVGDGPKYLIGGRIPAEVMQNW